MASSHLATTLFRTTKLASRQAAGGQPPPCSVRKCMLMRRTVVRTVLTLPTCLPYVLHRMRNYNVQCTTHDQALPKARTQPTPAMLTGRLLRARSERSLSPCCCLIAGCQQLEHTKQPGMTPGGPQQRHAGGMQHACAARHGRRQPSRC